MSHLAIGEVRSHGPSDGCMEDWGRLAELSVVGGVLEGVDVLLRDGGGQGLLLQAAGLVLRFLEYKLAEGVVEGGEVLVQGIEYPVVVVLPQLTAG